MDFRTYDLRNLFFMRDVALAWCEIEELTPQNKGAYLSMIWALIEAVWTGELQEAQEFVKHAESAPPPPLNIVFAREDLKRWAISKGQKPKFLFPEMRDEKRVRQEEHKAEKERREDKASVQAVARTLWTLFPDMTAEAIANHQTVEIFCNGKHWQPPTIKSWIREIDHRPKDSRAGRPRKSAAENIQSACENA